jgi:membrane protein
MAKPAGRSNVARWAGTIDARRRRLAGRAQAERRRHRSIDLAFGMVDRDGDVAGGIIAGALAYRLFIWLLPLGLVAVAGLGIAADATSRTPEGAAKAVGLVDVVSSSVASASRSSARWYALVIGIPTLVLATRSVLRVLIGAHRLVWADRRGADPRPTVLATLRLLALLLCFPLTTLAAAGIREWSTIPGILATLLAGLPYAALWLLVSIRLPHRSAPWTALLPGAALVGLGMELLSVASALAITPWVVAKQGTYGALGAAAALLIGLFLLSRLAVGAAMVNAMLWERRGPGTTGS